MRKAPMALALPPSRGRLFARTFEAVLLHKLRRNAGPTPGVFMSVLIGAIMGDAVCPPHQT
jgi:hypothetical protein